MYAHDGNRVVIAFRAQNRYVRFRLPLPDPKAEEFARTPVRRILRSPEGHAEAYEQAIRQRWRALALVIKAKLEAMPLRWEKAAGSDWLHGYAGSVLIASVGADGQLLWMRLLLLRRDKRYASVKGARAAAERDWQSFLRRAGLREVGGDAAG